MKKQTKEKVRYWMLRILEIVVVWFLFSTLAVIFAINVADFKMNVMYPNMCSCNYTPTLYFNQTVIDQCKIDCAQMRDDERSLTIGFLSICVFLFLYQIYVLIKGRVKPWLQCRWWI